MTSQERRTLLLLLRHAKSAWPDVPDHERPLARRGQQDAPLMGRWLRAAGYIPDRVVCSTARRAAQTWQLAQPALGSAPPAVFDDRLYDADTAQLLDVIRRCPGWPARWRRPRQPGPAPGSRPRRLTGRGQSSPTAAVAAFVFRSGWDQLAPGAARLACFVTPRQLRAAGDPGDGVTHLRA